MRNRACSIAPWILASICLAGCAGEEPVEQPQVSLLPPEVFDWSESPARFSPPPAWERQRVQSGGLQGVRFLKSGSPTFITVAEYTSLGRKHARIDAEGNRTDFDVPRPGFSIDDVVDRVRFNPKAKPPWVKIRPGPERDARVAGLAARSVGYIWDDKGKIQLGREYYVVAHGSLFVARYRGGEEDLVLFERVVETLEFPLPGGRT